MTSDQADTRARVRSTNPLRPSGFGLVVVYVFPLATAALMLVPFIYMLLVSFQHVRFLPGAPARWITQELTIDTYLDVLANTDILRWLLNSLIVAGAVALLGTLLSAGAGYFFFLNRDRRIVGVLFGALLLGMLVPKAVTIIPLFLMVRELGLLNSYAALIVPPLAVPIGVFLIRQAMFAFPMELIDAAKVDGCSEFRAFIQIVMPVLAPSLAVVAIITFMDQWREFLWPLIVTSRSEMSTIPVGGAGLSSEFSTDYGIYMAGAALAILPGAIAFIIFQRWLLKGLTEGAVRG